MGALEVGVQPGSRFKPGNELARRADERASWTCAIENGTGGFGTGMLIGPDLVLTNYHVIAGLLANPAKYTKARCRFDFADDPETGKVSEGRWVAFAQRWEGPWSPYSQKDEDGADFGFEPDRLDYAIIRLAESVGQQKVTVESSQRMPRGWLPLPSDPVPARQGADVSIWQHPVEPGTLLTRPAVMPLRWDDGVVLELIDDGKRLRHNVRTLKGSSGAACFNANLDIVALHHAGDPRADGEYNGKWNQAIPIAAIIGHLKGTGHGDLIGVVPPEPVRTAPVQAPAEREQQTDDVIGKRVHAATLLMDRDADEDGIAWARDKQNANRGIVHVITCRHIDSHRNFIERLARLSLASQNQGLDARRRRIDDFMKASVAAESWQRESLSWQPAQVPAERALEMMKRDLTQIANAKRRLVVDITVDVTGVNLAREKKLVAALAQYCSTIASADRLQIFIIYYDRLAKAGEDKTRERRKALTRLWTPDARPPGCGVCLHLEDIDSIELEGWCRSVQRLWQGEEGVLIGQVEQLFSSGRLPMLEAEQRVAPILRQNFGG